MGKKTKISSIVALATTPSACETAIKQFGGMAAITAEAKTLLKLALSEDASAVTDRARELAIGHCGVRRLMSHLTYAELRWFAAADYVYRKLLETAGKSYAENFTNTFKVGFVMGRLELLRNNKTGGPDLSKVPDEELQREQVAVAEKAVNTVNTVMCWHSNARHTYALSSDLVTLLSQTRLDKFPIKEVRLPFSTIEITLPADRINTLLGVSWQYPASTRLSFILSETEQGTGDGDIFISEIRAREDTIEGHTSLYIDTSSEETVEQHAHTAVQTVLRDKKPTIRKEGEDELLKSISRLFNFVVATLIYITTPDADNILSADSAEYAAWVKALKTKKKLSKREKKMIETPQDSNRHVLGNSIKIIDRHSYGADDDLTKTSGPARKSPVSHWRQGHMRSVHCGPKDGHQRLESRWIKPTLVAAPFSGAVPQPKKTVAR